MNEGALAAQKQICNVHRKLLFVYKLHTFYYIFLVIFSAWNCAISNFCVLRFSFQPLFNFPLVSKTEIFPLSEKLQNIFAFAKLCGKSCELILLHKQLLKLETFSMEFLIALNNESNYFDSNLCISRMKLILRKPAKLKICSGDLHNWWISCGIKHFI